MTGARATGMDLPRPRGAARGRGRWLLAGAALGLFMTATAVLSRARPAAPSVERASIWIAAVKRGAMVRQVRGHGTLVAEEVRWVTATSPGRVERIALLPGVAVQPDTLLMELDNPELRQAAAELVSRVRAAEARREQLSLQLESERLALESAIAGLRSELALARIEAEADGTLSEQGYAPELVARRSRAKAEQLAQRVTLESRRAGALGRSGRAQLVVQGLEIEKLRAERELRRQELEALSVRAGVSGVLQRLGDEQPPRVGQHVAAGAPLARIANQTKLKGAIQISETQAQDVQVGQRAAIDTRNGVVAGHVVRVDPAVQNGAVTVDVAFDQPLPPGARPDLSVDATITLERLADVLYIERPSGVQAAGQTRLFKVVDEGQGALRVPLRVGRVSVDTMELTGGARVGDQLILSDMSPWDGCDRLRLK